TALDPNKTLWNTLAPDGDYVFMGGDPGRPRHVAAYLKNFMFDPKRVRDDVGTLSGGMQNRLMLARTLINPGNVMILDEPTNDLDMDTLDMLQDILADYAGTLLIVSHDRDFLDRTVTEVMAFEGNAHITSTMGGYSDYLASKGGGRSAAAGKTKTSGDKAGDKTAAAPKVLSGAPPAPARRRLDGKEQRELQQLPDRIAKLEAKLADLHQQLADPQLYVRDPARFDALAAEITTAQAATDAAMASWMELEEKAYADPS
ncbi:MAG: ATP-binding cassette domain-containing protein, partial [Alphaproteobacteria bacterium]|nr:ATP-binding cassette domain-containing protein [Alphaproteobacteria bacterium]